MLPDLVFDRTALDDLAKIRMLRILQVTSYEAPQVQEKSKGLAGSIFFTGGHASFDVGVVDLVEKKVLCRGKGEAKSSEDIEVTRNADGGLIGNPGGEDLGRNIDRVARAALGKMSPLLK